MGEVSLDGSIMDIYQQFIYKRTYARFNYEKGRRENWNETVTRYVDFMKEKIGDSLTNNEYGEIWDAIYNMEALPSMRLLWSAGEAARKNPASAYNCTFMAVNKLCRFNEALFLLTSGTGVGFSCEREVVNQLPTIQKFKGGKIKTHVVADSREGWADALKIGLETWYSGEDIQFDYSKIRPLGTPLKTFGGRASGPDPLKQLLDFTRKKILAAQERKLRPIEVHDIFCMIAQIVVAGGTRRSSLISLSDLDDDEMRLAKTGDFPTYRYMANNSAVYKEKPDYETFSKEWKTLAESGTGERGIFNRGSILNQIPERRIQNIQNKVVGTNPCSEIILFDPGMCNLTNVVGNSKDTIETLLHKVKIATILGTYQSSLTDFSYLSSEWKENCDRECLLGVSLTGIYDNPILRDERVLRLLRDYAVSTNRKYAAKFGINPSAAVTCIKPSGNTSQLTNSSSGAHPRYSHFYVRRVRIAKADPLYEMMVDQGVPAYPEVGQEEDPTTMVLEFPIKAPDGSITRHDITALQQLEDWKTLRTNYTEHTVSATIYVAENEWDEVKEWVYANWEEIGGLSFFPKLDESIKYQLAPYEEISEDQFNLKMNQLKINFHHLSSYENGDNTSGAREYACTSGACEL